MHAPQIDLQQIRETIRKGQFDEKTLLLGTSLVAATAAQPDSKSHLQALSLTVECARELGHLKEAESLIRQPALRLRDRLHLESIRERVPLNNRRTETEYQLIRQELWCLLAYVRICNDLGRSDEALQTLLLLSEKIQEAVEADGWPGDLMFRGTRARLHYYYGIVIISLKKRSLDISRQPLEALQHFRIAMDLVWERWESQKRKHSGKPDRLSVEYQYALDSTARVLAFGYAFTFMLQTRLNDASAMLRSAALVADRGPNRLLQLSIATLRCHVRRHESGYQTKLTELLSELGSLCRQLARHRPQWRRAMFERGLTLVALLRSSDPACLERRVTYVNESKKVIDALTKEDDRDVKELQNEWNFQVLWLRALFNEAEGRYQNVRDSDTAKERFEIARRTLKDIEKISPTSISPLQHWSGQRWIISALVEIELGNIAEAESLLNRGRSDWESGPPWLAVLAHVRYAAVEAMRGQFDRAHDYLARAKALSQPMLSEFAWVANELQLAEQFVKTHQRELEKLTKITQDITKPVEKVRSIIRNVLQAEFESQRERFSNLRNPTHRESWYPEKAAANLGFNMRQLREWMDFAGIKFKKVVGRPPGTPMNERKH